MRKLLIFASLLIFYNCGRETKEKVYLPKIEFKRTKNPNYKNYFPQAEIPKQQENNDSRIKTTEISEPLPAFTSKSIKVAHPEKEKSAGIFDFLFGNTDSENDHSLKQWMSQTQIEQCENIFKDAGLQFV